MRFQIMDQSGHSTETFDSNVLSTEQAMKRFAELTGKGYRAVAPGVGGQPGEIVKAFDPNQETVLFIPSLQGG
jgi:hypothetical protein